MKLPRWLRRRQPISTADLILLMTLHAFLRESFKGASIDGVDTDDIVAALQRAIETLDHRRR